MTDANAALDKRSPTDSKAPAEFFAESATSAKHAAALMRVAPADPYCTRQYADALSVPGCHVWLLGCQREGRLVTGCYGLITSRRLSRSLRINSPPDPISDDVFWPGLMRFCSRHRITYLQL